MRDGVSGHRILMDDQNEQERPHVNQPLHGEPRPRLRPILAVTGLVVALVAIVAIITLVRYYAA